MVAVGCDFKEWPCFVRWTPSIGSIFVAVAAAINFKFTFKEGRSVALQWWLNGCFRCGKTKVVVVQSVLSPTVGYLSPTVGAKEINVFRAAELLCSGRPPSSGLAEKRVTVSEDNNYPSVWVWPGSEAKRVVFFLGDKAFRCHFAVRGKVCLGGSTAPVLFSSGREDERFTVDGETNLS